MALYFSIIKGSFSTKLFFKVIEDNYSWTEEVYKIGGKIAVEGGDEDLLRKGAYDC